MSIALQKTNKLKKCWHKQIKNKKEKKIKKKKKKKINYGANRWEYNRHRRQLVAIGWRGQT
jgi:hypothetical protein